MEKSCVSVEWTEGGATKGKEVGSMSMPVPHLTPSYLKDVCGNGTCVSLVFDVDLSSLVLNMVLFECIGILFRQACSKLKQSTVSVVFLESKLHRILKPLPTQASSECTLRMILIWGAKLIT